MSLEILVLFLLVFVVALSIYAIWRLAVKVGTVRVKMREVAKRTLVCPRCGSDQIFLFMGGIFGKVYRCPNCGYQGPVTIELEKIEES